MPPHRARWLLLFLFTLSGFAGLAYQSLWTFYLGLTLGHAAYAQALALCVYMGGMAVGAWWASRRILRIDNPLMMYAVVEIAIGLIALVFHPLFLAYQDWSQVHALPNLGRWVQVYQWGTSALWLFPQSVLLGATFPLMAAGARRVWTGTPDAKALGQLYGVNCAGAAMGALATTFVLLPLWGVPGSLLTAAVLNLVVGGGMAWLARDGKQDTPAVSQELEKPLTSPKRPSNGLLFIAGFTGLTSFVYEIVWIRLLNQVLGTTMHSFEIMLATFIAGLALGAWYVGKRQGTDHVRALAWAQLCMGLAAVGSTVLIAHFAFDWMGAWFDWTHKQEWGYQAFNLGSAAIAMSTMLPAAFFAGMTLPLITAILLHRGAGERAVGRVYAFNTLGAIVGVLLTIHALIPLMGLEHSLILAGLGDVVVGLVLFWKLGARRAWATGGALAVLSVFVAQQWGHISPHDQAAAVYRNGSVLANELVYDVIFSKDGKTSTVVVSKTNENTAWIATNGKPSAGLKLSLQDPPHIDEMVMNLLAALPLAAHPNPREVAVIGWGSGMTTHMLLGNPHLERVDTVEIEPVMFEAARLFGTRVERAYTDPRSYIIFDDARTYFVAENKHYDVIVSEPSNPWVSGVAGLFTQEFYGFMRSRLKPGGLVAQWLHTYQLNDELLAQMIGALLVEFPNTELYLVGSADLVFLSRTTPGTLNDAPLQVPHLRAELARVGLSDADALRSTLVAGPVQLAAFVRMTGAPVHRDFHPTVSLEAPKARFLGQQAEGLKTLSTFGLPIRQRFDHLPPLAHDPTRRPNPFLSAMVPASFIETEHMRLRPYEYDPEDLISLARLLKLSTGVVAPGQQNQWMDDAVRVFRASQRNADPQVFAQAWQQADWLAPGQPQAVMDVMQALRNTSAEEAGATRTASLDLLQDHPTLPAATREHFAVNVLLSDVGLRDCAGARVHLKLLEGVPHNDAMKLPRGLVEAWASGCAP